MNVYDQEDAGLLNTATFLVAIVFLYYDYLLTFGDEVRLIWTRPKSFGSIVFFLNRYPALILHLGTTFMRFSYYEGLVLLFFVQAIACVTLAIRTIALYERSRWIISVICGLAIICVVSASWSIRPRYAPLVLTREEYYILSIRGSPYSSPWNLALKAVFQGRATGWEAMLLFDCTTFALLMLRSYFEAKRYSTFGGIPLLNLLIRDGAIYFAVLAAVNTANIIMYYFGGPYCDATLATLASNISITIICRLCLNLREHAADINCSANFRGAQATAMSADWRFRGASAGITDGTIERTQTGINDTDYV